MGQEKKPALTPEESQEAAKQAAAQAAADVGKNKLLVLRQKRHVNMVCILFFNATWSRLLFPTLQKNESPFSILPQWLSVLGKKIDSAAQVQDSSFNL